MKTLKVQDPIILEFFNHLKDRFGDNLESLILYGSYARGEADEESDYDFLIVLNNCDNFSLEFNKISSIASELSLKYNTLISAFPVGLQSYLKRNDPLLLNIRREGIKIE